MKNTAAIFPRQSRFSPRPDYPAAVVMNMFYTGLGIARSLGERGIPVIGLSAHNIYGNYTRHANVRRAPDSREDPEALLEFLLRLAREIGSRSVLFPTRDDDLLFLDRFRQELTAGYIPVLPQPGALHACLDKWQTYVSACNAGVSVPQTWKIESREQLLNLQNVAFPCVLKPLSSHYWRRGRNWERIGSCKAIIVQSHEELVSEYERIMAVDSRALLQVAVPGADTGLVVAACYIDRASNFVAGFGAQKLLQIPEGFGTGCILQTADPSEVMPLALKLLREMQFNGIAEVEFKRDSSSDEYKLIEVNARPWDQHRLGRACGVDLIYMAYQDLADLPRREVIPQRPVETKWIAEDALTTASVCSLWHRDKKFLQRLRLASGKRMYGIWYAHDPLPGIAWVVHTIAAAARAVLRRFSCSIQRCFRLRRAWNANLRDLAK
jgi:D-aspartate ligase